jgi:gamma-glutamyltranspeptidase / glutathione hydrolase
MRNFHLAGRSTVHSQNAMVATSHPLAALTAIEVLRAGGTAADAAIAASALLAVIEPQSTGIGGDCFALMQPKGEGKIVAYNGSGRAPKAATPEWYLERNMHGIPLTSTHSVTIPGSIDAWATILPITASSAEAAIAASAAVPPARSTSMAVSAASG